jgi:hypothetical protein
MAVGHSDDVGYVRLRSIGQCSFSPNRDRDDGHRNVNFHRDTDADSSDTDTIFYRATIPIFHGDTIPIFHGDTIPIFSGDARSKSHADRSANGSTNTRIA